MIGNLVGGLEAVRAMRRLGQSVDDELRRELARRNRKVGEDPTRRTDAAWHLSELDRALRRQSAETDARSAVTGRGGEATAAAKASAAQTLGSATAAIAAKGEATRNLAERDYAEAERRLRSERRRLLGEHAREAVKAGF